MGCTRMGRKMTSKEGAKLPPTARFVLAPRKGGILAVMDQAPATIVT